MAQDTAYDPIVIIEQAYNEIFSNPTPSQTAAEETAWNNFFADAGAPLGLTSDQVQQNVANYSAAYDAQETDPTTSDFTTNSALQWGLIAGGAVLALLVIHEMSNKGRM